MRPNRNAKPSRLAIALMALSASGLIAIVGFEGWSETAYAPVAGDVVTYGFGTTTHVDGAPVLQGEKIKPLAALTRANADIEVKENAIKKCIHVPLFQYEYDAYVSLAYNIGERAFCKSSIARLANAGDYEGACRAILMYDRFKGKRLPGLTKRRQNEYRKCSGLP